MVCRKWATDFLSLSRARPAHVPLARASVSQMSRQLQKQFYLTTRWEGSPDLLTPLSCYGTPAPGGKAINLPTPPATHAQMCIALSSDAQPWLIWRAQFPGHALNPLSADLLSLPFITYAEVVGEHPIHWSIDADGTLYYIRASITVGVKNRLVELFGDPTRDEDGNLAWMTRFFFPRRHPASVVVDDKETHRSISLWARLL